MGKAKQLKKLKAMGRKLPGRVETVKVTKEVTGRMLLDRGIKTVQVDGVICAINPRKFYKLDTEMAQPVDHGAKLCRIYLETGKVSAVADYINQVHRVQKQTIPVDNPAANIQ
jgi:hypothetical protein